MTFTFDPTLASDRDKVRFHIGDTTSEGAYIEDETIDYFVTSYDVNTAVIQCIKHIITQLSVPDFNLDWMGVKNTAAARAGYEKLLIQKAQEFGISLTGAVPSATITYPHRADSFENNDGAYTDPDGL